jgi:putative ABC transport system substrate-binding protein
MSIRRRDFLGALSGAAAWPLVARAEQGAMPVIGFLHNGAPEATTQYYLPAFHKGLSETGFVEGRNVAIEYHWARNENGRLTELAADLVRRRVAVIVTPGSPLAALAAKAVTAKIPIVFSGSNPVQLGLVASLNRPGGNATGVNLFTQDVEAKKLELLVKLLPSVATIAILVNPNNPNFERQVKDLHEAARILGRQLEVLSASSAADFDAAFETIVRQRVGSLVVGADPFFDENGRDHLVALAARHAVPAIYSFREATAAGGLMSYGTNLADTAHIKGSYVGRILNGEKPADLPVQQPTSFEFVINLQTAKILGLTVPPTLRALADEVIE